MFLKIGEPLACLVELLLSVGQILALGFKVDAAPHGFFEKLGLGKEVGAAAGEDHFTGMDAGLEMAQGIFTALMFLDQ